MKEDPLDKYSGNAENSGQYEGSLLNRVARSMFVCVGNLPEKKRAEELRILTGGVCGILRDSFLGKLPIDEGIRRYLTSRAIAQGRSDVAYIAQIVDRTHKQTTTRNWLRAFTGEI